MSGAGYNPTLLGLGCNYLTGQQVKLKKIKLQAADKNLDKNKARVYIHSSHFNGKDVFKGRLTGGQFHT